MADKASSKMQHLVAAGAGAEAVAVVAAGHGHAISLDRDWDISKVFGFTFLFGLEHKHKYTFPSSDFLSISCLCLSICLLPILPIVATWEMRSCSICYHWKPLLWKSHLFHITTLTQTQKVKEKEKRGTLYNTGCLFSAHKYCRTHTTHKKPIYNC